MYLLTYLLTPCFNNTLLDLYHCLKSERQSWHFRSYTDQVRVDRGLTPRGPCLSYPPVEGADLLLLSFITPAGSTDKNIKTLKH